MKEIGDYIQQILILYSHTLTKIKFFTRVYALNLSYVAKMFPTMTRGYYILPAV